MNLENTSSQRLPAKSNLVDACMAEEVSPTVFDTGRQSNAQHAQRQLESFNPPQLRACWRETFKAPAPEISPNLMRHAIAYRLQEQRHSKLPASQLRQMAKLQKKLISSGTLGAATSIQMSAGTQLIRKWNGATHIVLVLDDCFEYNGTRFSSLTKIAQAITGAHWSGPRFFGLMRSSNGCSTNA